MTFVSQKRTKGRMREFLDDLAVNYNLYLMLLPAIAGFFVFHYLPIYGLSIAFRNYDIVLGFSESPWVGLKHFRAFFNDLFFFRTLRNTLLLGVYNLFFSFWPPILFAILLNEMKYPKLKKVYQTISYLPYFIAVVVIVGMLMEFSSPHGIFNKALVLFGKESIAFFNDPKYFRLMYIASDIWQSMGYGSIIYLATLSGVDLEQYEAAYIDGANRFQRTLHISIPALVPTAAVLLILSSSRIINVGFEKVFLMQNPAIYETADVIQTYVYRRGLQARDFSYASAVGLFNSLVSFAIVLTTNKLSISLSKNGIW